MKRTIILLGILLTMVGNMLADILTIEDITIGANETSTLHIGLNNESSTPSAYQFVLSLPEGTELAMNESGQYIYTLSARHQNHTLSIVRRPDGSYLLVGYSAQNKAINGVSGELISLDIKADVSVKGLQLQGEATEVLLSDATGKKSAASGTLFSISVVYPIITITNASRYYGDDNPTLNYTVSGALLNGTPTLTTEATVTSPTGDYTITATRGSMTNGYFEVVDGTLTIIKAPLRVSVGDYSRKEGEDNPVFELNYQGWKLNENETSLTIRPEVSTTATIDSPAGQYPITISGGESPNYNFTYQGGTLTILPSTGIEEINGDFRTFNVYNLNGSKLKIKVKSLKDLPSGVYIINRKKMMVK